MKLIFILLLWENVAKTAYFSMAKYIVINFDNI